METSSCKFDLIKLTKKADSVAECRNRTGECLDRVLIDDEAENVVEVSHICSSDHFVLLLKHLLTGMFKQ